jgi:radical SAM-linked protein
VSETRQRWRLIFARDEQARYIAHLDAVTLWERALRRGAIPVATTEGFTSRPRIIFAAPLQLGMLAEHDLADLYLSERLTAPNLRERLAAGMPAGYRIIDLHDVWINAPAIAPQLDAADYRMSLLGVTSGQLDAAVAGFMAADTRPRIRQRENRSISYDLRPLVLDLRVVEPDHEAMAALRDRTAVRIAAAPGARVGLGVTGAAGGDGFTVDNGDSAASTATPGVAGLWMRLRHSQDRGSGRPDEVIAALAEELGMSAIATDEEAAESVATTGAATGASKFGAAGGAAAPGATTGALEIVQPVRERLWLAEELNGARVNAPRGTTIRAGGEEPD